MWRCEKCNRVFKTVNQSHSCTTVDMGTLFLGKPDELVLALDKLITITASWEPNEVGVAKNAIVFTSQKAWLIVRPMKSVLDVKFYFGEELTSERIFKRAAWGKKYAHHIRVTSTDEIDGDVIALLRQGFEFSLV